jgi:hypothetical protein
MAEDLAALPTSETRAWSRATAGRSTGDVVCVSTPMPMDLIFAHCSWPRLTSQRAQIFFVQRVVAQKKARFALASASEAGVSVRNGGDQPILACDCRLLFTLEGNSSKRAEMTAVHGIQQLDDAGQSGAGESPHRPSE